MSECPMWEKADMGIPDIGTMHYRPVDEGTVDLGVARTGAGQSRNIGHDVGTRRDRSY